jgi:hypothetical protein
MSKRNIIAYYSGFLQRPEIAQAGIIDNDKNGFMNVICGLDRSKGLDLILHTPGGDLASTESLVDYLKQMFGNNIRAIIPQLAMSAGTVIACSCKSIVMGKQSSLGPIDPQIGGIPASGILEEFERAITDIKNRPSSIAVWREIIRRYPLTILGECEKAIQWSNQIAIKLLAENMLSAESQAEDKAKSIVEYLGDHSKTMSHSRHISADECERIGLKVERLEQIGQIYQDCILSIHHAYMYTFAASSISKIIESHTGEAMIFGGG